MCVNKLLNSKTCVDTSYCRSDLGLSCQSKTCLCDLNIQFWNGSICINYLTYNNETCSDSSECLSPMVCKLSGTSCDCPTTVQNTKCDCLLRKIGAEYYSTGSTCVLANQYGKTCSKNFTCQYLTQKTYCSGTCQCLTSEYFDTFKQMCETLVSYNGTCTQSDACNTGLG